jgi:hypothetical protein
MYVNLVLDKALSIIYVAHMKYNSADDLGLSSEKLIDFKLLSIHETFHSSLHWLHGNGSLNDAKK